MLVEALYVAYGAGRNGKSTFWNLISRVLGSYAGNVSADTLTEGCRRNTKPELAELRGKRIVLARELKENTKLDTSMLKQLASTDVIFAEKKFYAPAAFTPTHTTILCTNYFPRVDATDNGTWRRLIVIPFHAVFEENTDRKNYADYLYEHAAPAVLAWIIEGARRIIAKNYHLEPPKIIHDAIDEYRAENDWFSDYLTDCCETRDDFSEQSGALYQEYRAHCIRMGKPVRSTTVFYDALKRQGYTKARTNHGVVVYGLRIKRQ